MSRSRYPRLLEIGVVLLIIMIAGWLRLSRLDLMEFKADEAIAIEMTLPLAEGRALPTSGLVSSVGIRNPPMLMYLLAPALAMSREPIVIATFVAVLSTLSVLGTYLLLRPRFGAFVAVAAATFFATGPWAVLFGREIWAQDLLPPLAVLLLYALFVIAERARTWWIAAVPVLVCALWQLHFSGLALVPVAGAVLLARWRKLHLLALAAGIAVALVSLAPFLRYQVGTDWREIRSFREIGHARAQGLSASAMPLVLTSNLVGARRWTWVTGASAGAFASDTPIVQPLTTAVSLLMPALLMIGVATLAVCLARPLGMAIRQRTNLSDEDARGAILLVWICGIWTTFAVARLANIYVHYFVITYPVSFAIIAWVIDRGRRRAGRRWPQSANAAATGLVALIAATFLAFNVQFYRFVDKQGGTAGDYGVTFRDKDAVARFALDRELSIDAKTPEFKSLVDLRRGTPSVIPDAMRPAVAGHVMTLRDGLRETLACGRGETVAFGPLLGCVHP